MNEAGGGFGPAFGLAVLVPATLALFVVLVLAARGVGSLTGRFVMASLWLRYMMGAYHSYTFKPLVAGLSGNALASIAIVGIGGLVIRKRHLALAVLAPLYLLIALALASGALNDDPAGALNSVVKYAYFGVLLIATFEALRLDDRERFTSRLIWVFSPLLLFQLLSIALHLPKGSELGGGVVWIGGYNHEGAFSVALLTGFTVACLAFRLHPLLRLLFLFATLAGVFLAGYRTAMLAMLPLALATFWIGISHYVKPDQRRPVSLVVLMVCLAGAAAIVVAYQDRFADLVTFLSDPGSLIKAPRSFTQMDRQIMSGRALIWSEYLTAYANGTPLNHLFGFGPESWADAFKVYPHNTLISILYELGALGVGAMLLLWATMAAQAFGARRHERAILIAAHASFILLNFATMPFWQVEGLALYAVLCGYTLFSARAAAFSRAGAGWDSGPVPSRSPAARRETRRPPPGILHSRDSRRSPSARPAPGAGPSG
jgi:hypothetical protein